jgi:hypothetical protein
MNPQMIQNFGSNPGNLQQITNGEEGGAIAAAPPAPVQPPVETPPAPVQPPVETPAPTSVQPDAPVQPADPVKPAVVTNDDKSADPMKPAVVTNDDKPVVTNDDNSGAPVQPDAPVIAPAPPVIDPAPPVIAPAPAAVSAETTKLIAETRKLYEKVKPILDAKLAYTKQILKDIDTATRDTINTGKNKEIIGALEKSTKTLEKKPLEAKTDIDKTILEKYSDFFENGLKTLVAKINVTVDDINKLKTENKKNIEDFNSNLTKLDETQKTEYSDYSSELLTKVSEKATEEIIKELFITKITDSIEVQLSQEGKKDSTLYTLLNSQKDTDVTEVTSHLGGNNNSKSKKNRKSNKNKTKKRKIKKSNSKKIKFAKIKKM